MNQNLDIKNFLELSNYNDLVSYYEKKLEENSENYLDYIYLGLAYLLNGNQIESETTWFYLLTQENQEVSDLLIKCLDEITASFIKNNQLEVGILIYQNLKMIEPDDNNLQLHQTNNIIQAWIQEAINLTKSCLFNQAKQQYQLILKFENNFAYLWENLSLVHYELLEYQEAYQAILSAINLEHQNHLYFYYGGIFLEQLNNIESSIEFYKQSILLKPDHLDSYNNLGNILANNNNNEDAEKYYLLALELDKNNRGIYINLGNLYLKWGRVKEALDYYIQIISLSKDYETFLLIVNNIRSFNYIQESIDFARNNCYLLPNNLFAQLDYNRILPFIYENKKEINHYHRNLTNFLKGISEINLEREDNRLFGLQLTDIHTNYHLNYQGQNDLDLQCLYGNFIHQVMKTNYPHYYQPIKINKNREKIRVGYISYCLRSHVVGKLFLGWIKHHDRTKFEIYSYYLGNFPEDKITNKFRKYSDYFYHFSDNISTVNIAKKVRENELDILVFLDVGMYPRISQLAGLKLASIQCCAWGHPITSGIPSIDYFISSELMEEENSDNHYSEKLIKLPNLSIVYPQRELPKVEKDKIKFNLVEHKITYLSSQYCSKYLPQYDYIYPMIAQEIKHCQFVFIHPRVNQNHDKITNQLWKRIKENFKKYQLNWQDYCLFLPTITNNEDYWQLLKSCDIFLDTIGFTGFNSTLDAIESFLPVVTYSGEFFRTRQSEAILKMIQVTDTVANSVEDYLRISIELGKNDLYRQNISDRIKQNIDLLYDDLTPVKTLEKFYDDVINNSSKL